MIGWPAAGGKVPVANLIYRARLHWARRYLGPGSVFSYTETSYSTHTYDWIPPDELRLVATRLASLAGLIAHELMHLVWRRDFDYRGSASSGWIEPYGRNTHGHGHGWGEFCCGPPMSLSALQPYSFTHDSEYEPTASVSTGSRTSTRVNPGVAPARSTRVGSDQREESWLPSSDRRSGPCLDIVPVVRLVTRPCFL